MNIVADVLTSVSLELPSAAHLKIDGVSLGDYITKLVEEMIGDGGDEKPEKKTITVPGVVVTQTIPADFMDPKNSEKKRQYEHAFLKQSMAGEGSFAEYERVELAGRRLGSHEGALMVD